MQTLTVQSEVSRDGKLKIDVPCELTPGPVEVVMTVRSQVEPKPHGRPSWGSLHGLGREVWRDIDPKQYIEELRQDREAP